METAKKNTAVDRLGQGWPATPPRVTIPDVGVAEGKYGQLIFTIGTHQGPISVESRGATSRWRCRGTAAALIEQGLTDPVWLPGLHGNNKTRQSVLFGPDGPRLLHGNRKGRKLDGEIVTVIRESKNAFTAEIPATPEQATRIESLYDSWRERDRRDHGARMAEKERQAYLAKQKQLPAGDIRFQAGGMVATGQSLAMRVIETSAYCLDPRAVAAIDEHFRQIQALINGSALKPKLTKAGDGNVVYLNR